jgi:hypothetical protein
LSGLELLENSGLAELVRSSAPLYAVLQTAHLVAMAALVGTGLTLDVRLLGLTRIGLRPLLRFTEPVLQVAALVAFTTGLAMFAAEATTMAANSAFQAKVVLLGLLVGNTLGFHLGARRHLDAWADAPTPPLAARVTGGLAIVSWIGVVAAARLIAFV